VDFEYTVVSAAGAQAEAWLKNAPPDTAMETVGRERLLSLPMVGQEGIESLKQELLTRPRTVLWDSSLTFALDDRFKPLFGFAEAIPTQMLLALQKNSELRPLFNFHLLDMIQSGVAARLTHRWLKEAAPPDTSERIFVEEARPLGYDNLFFPSAVLTVGAVAALILAAVEFAKRKSVLVQPGLQNGRPTSTFMGQRRNSL
jgi:hypothetical protein